MENNEKIFLFKKNQEVQKSRCNSIKNIFGNKEPNKIVILILIIISSIQFLIIIISFNNENKTTYIDDISKVNGRLFLYKKDENTSIKKDKINIQIVMTTDNKGIYPTLVSMASALENNDERKNILIYHLLLSHDFKMNKIYYFESLKEKYNFRINYYKIPNFFKKIRKWRKSNTVYYKLLIPLIFSDFERVIYLDSDTLIFQELSEMFDLPFNDNYVLGFPFHTPWILRINGKFPKKYINAGVMLINIPEIRKHNKDIELIQYTFKNAKKLFFLEQDGLNVIYYNKTGILPLKYGVYLFGNITEFNKKYARKFLLKFNQKELQNAIEEPSIVHLCCCNPKIWFKKTHQEKGFNHICKKYQKQFYFFANKTKYYDEIYNIYMK